MLFRSIVGQRYKHAFNDFYKEITIDIDSKNIKSAFNKIKSRIQYEADKELNNKQFQDYNMNVSVNLTYEMFKNNDKNNIITHYFPIAPKTLLTENSLIEFINNGFFDFENNLETTELESDLTIDKIVSVELTIGHIKNVLNGSCM